MCKLRFPDIISHINSHINSMRKVPVARVIYGSQFTPWYFPREHVQSLVQPWICMFILRLFTYHQYWKFWRTASACSKYPTTTQNCRIAKKPFFLWPDRDYLGYLLIKEGIKPVYENSSRSRSPISYHPKRPWE